MSKCIGCGVKSNQELCERCFRIKNYSDYKLVDIGNDVFLNILKSINKSNALVILVVDLFMFNDLKEIRKYLNNDILLVLTKRDLLPKSVSDEKLCSYFKTFNYKDIIVVSSNKNYNFDTLYKLINKHKKGNDVYVVGFTNAGKSTLINKLIYNYSDNSSNITTSFLPSTTLDCINIKLNDELTLIDTPGILTCKSLYNLVDGKDLKKIVPQREVRPISYQIRGRQYIVIDKYCILEVVDINIILFMSKNLDIKRVYKYDTDFNIKMEVYNNDIVINGLGFVKCSGIGIIKIHSNYNIDIYTRKSLI